MSIFSSVMMSKRGNPWGDSPKGGSKRPSGGGGYRPGGNGPDIDDVLREAQNRMKHMMGGRSGGGSGEPGGKKIFGFIAVALGFVWLGSGIYIVAPDENGVVLRFGEYVKTVTEPGPNYHLPFPIETVMKPKVTRENIVEVGFRGSRSVGQVFGQQMRQRLRDDQIVDVQPESLMLTGDENIVDLDFTVRWRIGIPENYLFKVSNPDDALKSIAESAMREVIGKHPIDDALTENRAMIQEEVRTLIQEVADSYEMGVLVSGVELQQVNPPAPVIEAFRDVQAARADKERAQNEAIGYANDILPRARGEAARILQEAEAYKSARVSEAEGAAARFTSQLKEYRLAKEVTKERLYLETMQDIMKNTQKVVLTEGAGGSVLPYLPLERMKEGGKR